MVASGKLLLTTGKMLRESEDIAIKNNSIGRRAISNGKSYYGVGGWLLRYTRSPSLESSKVVMEVLEAISTISS